jgi:hypothetical protein
MNSAWARRERARSPAPKVVEFEKRDHDDDQGFQHETEEHTWHAAQQGERSVLGPLQTLAAALERGARGAKCTAVLSNACCARLDHGVLSSDLNLTH